MSLFDHHYKKFRWGDIRQGPSTPCQQKPPSRRRKYCSVPRPSCKERVGHYQASRSSDVDETRHHHPSFRTKSSATRPFNQGLNSKSVTSWLFMTETPRGDDHRYNQITR